MSTATFTYNGKTNQLSDASAWRGTPLESFLEEWYDSNDYVMGHTSGSTGSPKSIMLNKKSMEASAKLTNQHFGLKEGDRILLCLSTDYIAGKMIVVRALVGGLQIYVAETKSLPNWNGDIRFAALVPMQVEALLHDSKESKERLRRIQTIIIGGSPLNESLQKELLESGIKDAYTTYGMTETLSHVAVAKIGEGEELTYNALKGITFTTDDRSCLVISAPHIQEVPFVTNDIVDLASPTSFRWKGRWDNVINSGGVKLFPEKIEKTLAPLFPRNRFYLTGAPDDRFGTKLVLKIEGEPYADIELSQLKFAMRQLLGRLEQPKEIIFTKQFSETSTGKVKRI